MLLCCCQLPEMVVAGSILALRNKTYRRLSWSNDLTVSFRPAFLLDHVGGVGGVLVNRAVLGHGDILVSVGHDLLIFLTVILGIIFTRSGPAVSTAAAVAVAVAKVSPLAAADRIIMLHWRLVEWSGVLTWYPWSDLCSSVWHSRDLWRNSYGWNRKYNIKCSSVPMTGTQICTILSVPKYVQMAFTMLMTKVKTETSNDCLDCLLDIEQGWLTLTVGENCFSILASIYKSSHKS